MDNEYITEENVEKTIEELKKLSEREVDHIIRTAMEHIKRSP